MNRSRLKSVLQISVSLAVTLLCLFLAFRQISFQQILASSNEINWWIAFLASVMAILAIGLRAWRWQMILKPIKHLQFGKVFNFTMIGFMANNIFPAHAGELVRAYLMGRKTKTGFFSVSSTILIERLFDGVAIIVLLVIIMLFIDGPNWLHYGSIAAAITVLSALLLLGVLASNQSKLRVLLFRLLDLLPKKIKPKVRAKLDAFLYGLNMLKDWNTILPVIALSFLLWLFMGLTVYVILISFPITNYVAINMELLSLTTVILLSLAVIIPSSPGYIGVTQLVFITTFGLFTDPETIDGIVKSYILNGSIIFNFTQYLPVTILGIILLFKEGLSFKSLNVKKKSMTSKTLPTKVEIASE